MFQQKEGMKEKTRIGERKKERILHFALQGYARLPVTGSFSYPSTIAHRFLNNTDAEAMMVWAMAPVRITW